MNKCQECGHEGEDVHVYPTNKEGHGITEPQCDDITACLERKYRQANSRETLKTTCPEDRS
jgi:hypothetical protein